MIVGRANAYERRVLKDSKVSDGKFGEVYVVCQRYQVYNYNAKMEDKAG